MGTNDNEFYSVFIGEICGIEIVQSALLRLLFNDYSYTILALNSYTSLL